MAAAAQSMRSDRGSRRERRIEEEEDGPEITCFLKVKFERNKFGANKQISLLTTTGTDPARRHHSTASNKVAASASTKTKSAVVVTPEEEGGLE